MKPLLQIEVRAADEILNILKIITEKIAPNAVVNLIKDVSEQIEEKQIEEKQIEEKQIEEKQIEERIDNELEKLIEKDETMSRDKIFIEVEKIIKSCKKRNLTADEICDVLNDKKIPTLGKRTTGWTKSMIYCFPKRLKVNEKRNSNG